MHPARIFWLCASLGLALTNKSVAPSAPVLSGCKSATQPHQKSVAPSAQSLALCKPTTCKGWLQKSRQVHTLCNVLIFAAALIAASRSEHILGKSSISRRFRACRPSCGTLFSTRVLTTRGRPETYMCHDLCNPPLLPCTGSREGAGTVVNTDSDVDKFQTGDRVMCGLQYHPCGTCIECIGPENEPMEMCKKQSFKESRFVKCQSQHHHNRDCYPLNSRHLELLES